jgi:hypothetical protein
MDPATCGSERSYIMFERLEAAQQHVYWERRGNEQKRVVVVVPICFFVS